MKRKGLLRRISAWVVALGTVYALMNPAMTLEQAACPLPEHTHTEGCYAQQRQPVCSCEGEVVHTHDEACYLEDGTLWCTLPETAAHVHDESCYAPDAHSHTEACYETAPGELICTVHTHAEDCYARQQLLICGLAESEEHAHGEGCYQAETIRVCGVEEDHSHTEACYAPVESLVCGFPEEPEQALLCPGETRPAHQHGDACFQILQTLICGMEEHSHTESCQPEQAEPTQEPGEDAEQTELAPWVAELKLTPYREDVPGMPWFVRNGERADYRLEIRTEGDAAGLGGRVRLEFVLPLTEQEGAFDEQTLLWLEDAALTQETRAIGEAELPCQVLTGFKTLPQEDAQAPGAFTETLSIRLLAAEPGRTVPLLVSAAMHQTDEGLTVAAEGFTAACTAQEAQANYEAFLAQLEEPTEDAEAMFSRLSEAYQQGQLTQADYRALYGQLFALCYGDPETLAERATGSNWMALRDSGWFGAYAATAVRSAPLRAAPFSALAPTATAAGPSDVQVVNRGGQRQRGRRGFRQQGHRRDGAGKCL